MSKYISSITLGSTTYNLDSRDITTTTSSTLSISVNSTLKRSQTYICGTLTSLTFSSIAETPYEVVVIFTSGTTPTTISIPSGTKYVSNNGAVAEASTSYIAAVVGGVFVMKKLETA